jgi:DNA primase
MQRFSSKGARRNDELFRLRDEIKARIDYRAFFSRYVVQARQSSSVRWQAMCPIASHAHTGTGHPSLSVDLARGLFHCFSREEGGDAIRFYELMHGVSFARAVREMARELGIEDSSQLPLRFRAAPDIETPEHETLAPLDAEEFSHVCAKFLDTCGAEDQVEGLNYLARRGINHEISLRAGVKYFPRRAYARVMRRMKDEFAGDTLLRSGLFNSRGHLTFYRHRLLFPFLVETRPIYLQARTTAGAVEPRWHNLRGSVPCLYNIDVLSELPSGSIVYLVEGFTDTLTLAAHNFAAVGLVGAGGLREEWIAPLARFRVIAALDPDAAGRRAIHRYREMFAARGLKLTGLNLPRDVNDFFRSRSSAALEFALMTEIALETKIDFDDRVKT